MNSIRAIWACRWTAWGSVDGWDFKSLCAGCDVLSLCLMSESRPNKLHQRGRWKPEEVGFDYAQLSDEGHWTGSRNLVKTEDSSFCPASFLQCQKRAANDENLNMTLEAAFNHIEESSKGAAKAKIILRDCLMILTSTATSWEPPLQSVMQTSWSWSRERYKHGLETGIIPLCLWRCLRYLMVMCISTGKSDGEFFTLPKRFDFWLVWLLLENRGQQGLWPCLWFWFSASESGEFLAKENVVRNFTVRKSTWLYNLAASICSCMTLILTNFDIAHESLCCLHSIGTMNRLRLLPNPLTLLNWRAMTIPVFDKWPSFLSCRGAYRSQSWPCLYHALSGGAPTELRRLLLLPRRNMYRGGAEEESASIWLTTTSWLHHQLPSNLFFGTSLRPVSWFWSVAKRITVPCSLMLPGVCQGHEQQPSDRRKHSSHRRRVYFPKRYATLFPPCQLWRDQNTGLQSICQYLCWAGGIREEKLLILWNSMREIVWRNHGREQILREEIARSLQKLRGQKWTGRTGTIHNRQQKSVDTISFPCREWQ